MTKKTKHELVFKNGASLVVNDVSIDVEYSQSEISKFDVAGSTGSDILKFIDVKELVCVVERTVELETPRKKWWSR